MSVHGIKMQKSLQTIVDTFSNFNKPSYNHDSSNHDSSHSHTEILSITPVTLKSFIQHKIIFKS